MSVIDQRTEHKYSHGSIVHNHKHLISFPSLFLISEDFVIPKIPHWGKKSPGCAAADSVGFKCKPVVRLYKQTKDI